MEERAKLRVDSEFWDKHFNEVSLCGSFISLGTVGDNDNIYVLSVSSI